MGRRAPSQVSPYWDLVDDGGRWRGKFGAPANGEKLAVEQLQPMLEEAVRMQLVSDVPVGVFLSGGIDSSALVSILSRGGVTPSTFSIVFREAEFSEAQHSRAVAAKFRTDHHEIKVSQTDVLAAIPDALECDGPAHDGRHEYLLRLARNTESRGEGSVVGAGRRRSIRRVLFLPHRSSHGALRAALESRARLGTRSVASLFAALSPQNDQNRKLASLMCDKGRELHPYFLSRMLFTPGQCRTAARKTTGLHFETADDIATGSPARALRLDPVNRVSYLESRCYMLNTLLRDSDFMSMSQGLEVRVPLIDHQLAKAVLALPGKWKLNGTPKKLLVDALAGSLPDEIVHRPKRGFTLPFEHWMRQELRQRSNPCWRSRISEGPLGGLLKANR